ncbi:MAG: hypothetical protein FIA82_13210 [Melioribacter sp.]|nr:hypothetical protein [Melioribacter sp.]
MNNVFLINTRSDLFRQILIVIVVFIIHSSFTPALNSINPVNDAGSNSQKEFSINAANQTENNLSTQAVNNIDLDTFDFDLLDYDDYVKLHRILDHSNINLYINHLPKTFITRKTSPLNNLFPQYPPMAKVIRLKIFLI